MVIILESIFVDTIYPGQRVEKMNKKFKYRTIIVIALVIIGCLIYCLSPVRNRFSRLRPEDQNNTTWISEIPMLTRYNGYDEGAVTYGDQVYKYYCVFDNYNKLSMQ